MALCCECALLCLLIKICSVSVNLVGCFSFVENAFGIGSENAIFGHSVSVENRKMTTPLLSKY